MKTRNLQLMAVVVLALCLNVTTAVLATDNIDPGDNHYSCPAALFCSPPIPADFFGPGSDPFEGQIACQGDPSNNGLDTTVRRTAPGFVPAPYPITDPIPIEIIELSLVSIAPITVTYNGGVDPELWDVEVTLSSTPAPTGTMTVTKTHANGGTFHAEFYVQPEFTFTKVSNPTEVRTLDTGLEGIPPTQYNDVAPYSWYESPIQGDFNPTGPNPLGMSSGGSGCTLTLVPYLIRCDWFDAAFDPFGNFMGGGGSGYDDGLGPWYFYPWYGWWNQWFYDHPYDPDRSKYIYTDLWLFPIDPGFGSWATIIYNWTTPDWADPTRPPLPGDVIDPIREDLFIGRSDAMEIYIYDGPVPLTGIPVPHEFYFQDYNPEWISIDVWGYNFQLVSEVFCHICEASDDPIAEDWGDAIDPTFPTLAVSNGARHVIVQGFQLGASVDPEGNGQPTVPADGDDTDGNNDADGVAFVTPLIPGQAATVNVTASVGGGLLDAWIDFDNDGSWAQAGDQIAAALPLAAGVNAVGFAVPAGAAAGTTPYARFRFSTFPGLPYDGPAPNGEVEDYRVPIEEDQTLVKVIKFQQLPLDGLQYWGHDELSTAYSWHDYIGGGNQAQIVGYRGCYMADDFADLKNTPVICIKWWGSYLNNEIDDAHPVRKFLIVFEEDVPADGIIPYSHPGAVLSSEVVYFETNPANLGPGQYSEERVSDGGFPCSETLYEYNAILECPFPQEPDTVYWLKIVALVDLDPAMSGELEGCMDNHLDGLCGILKLPPWERPNYCPGLPVLTRWGWHNRDYTIMDPYASTSPAVVPGEHNANDPPIAGFPDEVWHFQDDAVSGNIFVDIFNQLDPACESPYPEQQDWMEEYYVYWLPTCSSATGVDGPVEIEQFSKDLAFELYTEEVVELDWGDADDAPGIPPGYVTLAINNGASHVIVQSIFLGNLVDGEPDGQPTPTADGDDLDILYPSLGDDEDGVIFNTWPLIPGQPATATVTASVDGWLDAWVDFNGDGSWAPASDLIYSGPILAGPNPIIFNVPAAAGPNITTVSRWRFNTFGPLPYDGPAPDGEVEDHLVDIGQAEEILYKWSQPPVLNPDGSQYPGCYWGWDDPSIYGDDIPMLHPIDADDWLCQDYRPVTDIHWWGSYQSWEAPDPPLPPFAPIGFYIGIWTDIPAGTDAPWSHPGRLIWEWRPTMAEVSEQFDGCDFYPAEPAFMTFPDTCFKYDFQIPQSEWFWQEGPDTIYWLSIAAIYQDPDVFDYVWGWKTREHFFNDDAVRIVLPSAPDLAAGFDTYIEGYPIEHEGVSWDMAFELTTQECYAGMPDYSEWIMAHSPGCWCWPRQCRGDADGLVQGIPVVGLKWVDTWDLTKLIDCWQIKDPPKGPGITAEQACADFDHLRQGIAVVGLKRCDTWDLTILINNWQIKEPPKGPGVPPDCLPGNVIP